MFYLITYNIMRRKVVQQGTSTLMVSLPSEWVKKQGLKRGDELALSCEPDHLKLYTEKSHKPSKPEKSAKLTLNLHNKSEIRSIIGAYYRSGYDVLNLNFENEETFNMVSDSVSNLIGFDIIERKKNNCIIKSFLKENPSELSVTIKKICHSISTVNDIVREDYNKSDYSRLSLLEYYRFNVWKLRDLSMRLITVRTEVFDSSQNALYLVLWNIEKIHRNYKRMYAAMIFNNSKHSSDFLSYYDLVWNYTSSFIKAFLKKEQGKFEILNEKHNELVPTAFALMSKNSKDNILISYLLENVRRIQDMVSLLVIVSCSDDQNGPIRS